MSVYGSSGRLQFSRARHLARALGDPLHLRDELLHRPRRPRADEKDGAGVLRHDVRGVAAVGDDAMDARVRSDVLPEGVDAVEGLDHGVQGVDAVVRIGGGVRGLAVKGDFNSRDGE